MDEPLDFRSAQCGRGRFSSMAAVLLIAAGTILFLANLGILPDIRFRALWPLWISAWGVASLSWRRCSIWSWLMIAMGILLTLSNLGYLHVSMRALWPLFMIAAGISMLFRRVRPRRPQYERYVAGASVRGTSHDNYIRESASFSAVSRRIDSQNFEGAELNSMFGELKIDLRAADISSASREATIDASSAFGAIKLRIPETWKVVLDGDAVFGVYEDKTVPPRPGPDGELKKLIVRGHCAFGAVEIEN